MEKEVGAANGGPPRGRCEQHQSLETLVEAGRVGEDQNIWLASASWVDSMPSYSGQQTHLQRVWLSGLLERRGRYQAYIFHM